MKVSSEFLLIEDGKAVIKTLEKEIVKYECLEICREKINPLDKDEISKRISHLNYNEVKAFKSVFEKEFHKSNIDKTIAFHSNLDEFYLPFNTDKELKKEFKEFREDEGLKTRDLSGELQGLISSELKQDTINIFNKVYDSYFKVEKKKFIKEKLKDIYIAFCREGTPNGYHSMSFKFKDLEINRFSNLGYGPVSFDKLNLELPNLKKIFRIHSIYNHGFKLNMDTGFTLENAHFELMEYLENPIEYRKQFMLNNIRFLKELLGNEEEIIPIIENTIIPDLKNKIESAKKKSDRNELKKELKAYVKSSEGFKVESYEAVAITIEDRKIRIEYLKSKINSLLKAYKSEEGLLDYV
jgi:hypothetical protein